MRTSTWRAALVAGAVAIAASGGPAGAEPERARGRHGGFGGGGFLGVTGPGKGLAFGADFYPAGWFGRYGVRGETRVFEDDGGELRGLGTLGVIYEAAAARPRLQLALHAEAGVALLSDPLPVLGGGVETHLWIIGPLALVAGAGAILYLDGTDTVLGLGTHTQVRLAW